MTAMGHEMSRFLEANPTIARAFETYQVCRTIQIVVVKRSKGSGKDAREEQVLVYWPQGFSILPEPGGLNNQSYYDVRLFSAFLAGEREGVMRKLQIG
jgi:hypothetical protein